MYGSISVHIVCHLVVVVLSLSGVVGLQRQNDAEGLLFPDPNITTRVFNDSASFRQDFCAVQQLIDRGDLELKDALSGRSIRTVFLEDEYINVNSDGSIDENDPGMMVVIMDELARRGGFSWKSSFAINEYLHLDPENVNKTYTDLLLWQTDTYDLSATWWFGLSSRSEKGVSFPKGWYDASIIIIGNTNDSDSLTDTFQILSWTSPFENAVWAFLVATLIFTAFVYMILEQRDWSINSLFGRERISSSWNLTAQYLYKAFMAFTGHLDTKSETKTGALISLSLSFFAMLMLSSYTANLVGFLVQKNLESDRNVQTVGDIVRRNLIMCVIGGGAKQQVIAEAYPNSIFYETDSEKDVFIALNEGFCNYGITSVAGWQKYGESVEVNSQCNLLRTGRPFRNYEGGFATKVDVGTLCTSLIREVLHIHFQKMSEDGFLSETWKNQLKGTANNSCKASDEPESDQPLSLSNLGSIFVFHYFLVLIAIIFACFGRCCGMRVTQGPASDNRQSFFVGPNGLDLGNNGSSTFSNGEELAAINEKLGTINSILEEIKESKSRSSGENYLVDPYVPKEEGKSKIRFSLEEDFLSDRDLGNFQSTSHS